MDTTTPPTTGLDLRTPAPAGGGTTAQTSGQGDDTSLFSKFDIPQTVREKYSDLIPLILQTESMNDDERQYWFQILPIMTDDQVLKLREILDNEKKQLAEIDKQYNREVKTINEEHVAEWKEFEVKAKRDELKAAESTAAKQDKSHEEALLGQLQSL